MNILGIIGKVRKIIGKLTDVLLKGREAGLWDKGKGPGDQWKRK